MTQKSDYSSYNTTHTYARSLKTIPNISHLSVQRQALRSPIRKTGKEALTETVVPDAKSWNENITPLFHCTVTRHQIVRYPFTPTTMPRTQAAPLNEPNQGRWFLSTIFAFRLFDFFFFRIIEAGPTRTQMTEYISFPGGHCAIEQTRQTLLCFSSQLF